MARYVVKASVTVDVEMSIEAETAPGALSLFKEHLIMNATLADVPPNQFDAYEDCITEIRRDRVEAE